MVRFDNVGMRYGVGQEVLRDVSFELPRGSFTYLTGASGAGKSSLLKLMFLAHRPSRGMIEILGQDLSRLPRPAMPALRRQIGVVYQDFRLIDHMSVFDNVALPLRVAGNPEPDIRAHVEELLGWVGLADRIRATPPELSGGEQQRVAIARAVIARPRLLLADEPTGSVDPDMGDRLMHLFLELNRIGTTILIATHDIAMMERHRAAVLRLVRGELVLGGHG
ncbi:cell division ATP-binding protein FtsE [Zavarzinia compransoris]|uniref:Cell division ATP-binding protein FtsE n=1 Tax=Zavarzinia compransoris TaxID=1264899 RepID=A0A317E595_9PROT|nr:cell division ATP-binding protein FtsE [Zavarzinia compransoris]PWR21752.1 cell division ATP-binding protein FtsE [Zavarzinia compransoris]TDP45456.1 cell division transport system ATP-binding protein [Zavarzinia compransoris]